eukprot:732796-Pelagomonas_calceolata.AAC.1
MAVALSTLCTMGVKSFQLMFTPGSVISFCADDDDDGDDDDGDDDDGDGDDDDENVVTTLIAVWMCSSSTSWTTINIPPWLRQSSYGCRQANLPVPVLTYCSHPMHATGEDAHSLLFTYCSLPVHAQGGRGAKQEGTARITQEEVHSKRCTGRGAQQEEHSKRCTARGLHVHTHKGETCTACAC